MNSDEMDRLRKMTDKELLLECYNFLCEVGIGYKDSERFYDRSLGLRVTINLRYVK